MLMERLICCTNCGACADPEINYFGCYCGIYYDAVACYSYIVQLWVFILILQIILEEFIFEDSTSRLNEISKNKLPSKITHYTIPPQCTHLSWLTAVWECGVNTHGLCIIHEHTNT